MTKYSYREMTYEDVLNYYGKPIDFSMVGYSILENDNVIGLVGIREFHGDNLFFSDIKLTSIPKITIWRFARKFVILLTNRYKNIIAVSDGTYCNSVRFLECLGFELSYEWEGQKVYRWLTHSQ
jgi:hypothetical protein